MSKVTATGRVISDPVLKVSVKKTPYITFTLMERIGLEQYSRLQYLQVWAWGDLAVQMSEAGVKRSSWLRINGYLELADYVKPDGVTRDKKLKVRLTDWNFLPKDQSTTGPNPGDAAAENVAVIHGDREKLPE